ncbi:SgcJ/EcaC family oxidoreductase [Catellatospora tritici]|uniref:SgcJ/EcaC family oxidoreductase n=1 Tax=Catellatospora tritici TaxID=2851566 RepID=UPI001C2DE7BC|nr:SgcJ/EcaC family oxidoreductase [Catellatospora tritici]MBV1855993.1 SgcJ/EcaC family oxidoreductase [Catellatospora tritici]
MTSTDRTTDRAAITGVLDMISRAWDAADADAFGRAFTEDASYVTFVGTEYHGRADITESHRALFRAFTKGTRLTGEITSLRFLGPDTAVVVGRGDTYKGRPPSKPTKIQTFVLVRQPDGWRVAAFHNTRRRGLMEAMQFRFAPATRPLAAR